MPISKYEKGQKGQTEAENFLQKNNYKILEKNFRTRTGEIDLIAFDNKNGYIAFIEVKYRTSTNYGLPSEAVGSKKQQKIIRTALYYISKNKLSDRDFRFDVIEVLGTSVNHIENAFDLR